MNNAAIMTKRPRGNKASKERIINDRLEKTPNAAIQALKEFLNLASERVIVIVIDQSTTTITSSFNDTMTIMGDSNKATMSKQDPV